MFYSKSTFQLCVRHREKKKGGISFLQSHFFEEDTSALVFNNFQLSSSLQSVNVFQDMNQLSFQGDMNGLQDRCCCAFLAF